MPSKTPMIIFLLKIIGSFLMHIVGAVILTMMVGTTFFLILCFVKDFCITSSLSWAALEFIFFILGLVIGVYNFTKS